MCIALGANDRPGRSPAWIGSSFCPQESGKSPRRFPCGRPVLRTGDVSTGRSASYLSFQEREAWAREEVHYAVRIAG